MEDDLLGVEESPAEQAAEQKRLGNEAFKRKDLDGAIRCYSKAVDLDPAQALYLSNRAAAYLAQKDFEKAAADCTAALELEPGIKAFARRGTARVALGDLTGAADDFQSALGFEPRNKQCLKSLAGVYDQLEARAAAEEAGAAAVGGGARRPNGVCVAVQGTTPTARKRRKRIRVQHTAKQFQAALQTGRTDRRIDSQWRHKRQRAHRARKRAYLRRTPVHPKATLRQPAYHHTWHDIVRGDIAAVIVLEDVTEPQRLDPPSFPESERNVQPMSQLLDLKPPR